MTAKCGGGASRKKNISPAVLFLSGETLTALVTSTLGLPAVWVSLLSFAAAQSIDLGPFCTGDPPAMPTFSALEIADIINPLGITSAPTLAKVGDLVEIAAWYAFCECVSGSPPTPTPPPTYPPTAPTINPPGFTTPPNSCWSKTWNSGPMGGFALPADVFPPPPVGRTQQRIAYVEAFPGSPTFQFTWTCNTDGSANETLWGDVAFFDTGGRSLGTIRTPAIAPGAAPFTENIVPPAGWDRMQASTAFVSGPTGTNTATVQLTIFCDKSGNGTPVSNCCPPDPSLEARLVRMQQLLELIFQGLPTVPTSYAEATVHAGLIGQGTVTLVDAPIAVKVTITNDNPHLGVSAGTPAFLWDRGYIVPIAAEGPIAGITRLEYSPQLYILPLLTEQIGWKTGPGVTVSITELVRGP